MGLDRRVGCTAGSFGWTPNLSRSRPIIDGTKRPRLSDEIVKLAGSAENCRIGDLCSRVYLRSTT